MAERGRWWLFAVLGGLVIIGALGGAVHYSESPAFCHSCHIMEPYYQAWKGSAHKNVACVECHYPPAGPQTLLWKKFQALNQVVKYVTRTYSSKPFAEVDDASCLRSGCHATRLLTGKVKTAKAGIKFDHTPHLTEVRRGRQLKCVSCHSQVVVGKHIEVTYTTCYLCHFKGRGAGKDLKPLGGCLGCHDLPAKSFQLGSMTYNHKDFVTKQGVSCQNCHLNVVRGTGDVSQDRCYTCHNQPEKVARFKDTAFIHENHVTKHNVACLHCHDEIKHGFAEKDAAALSISTAAPAHHPTVNFECGYCHQGMHAGQQVMYSGKSPGLGLADMPSPMFTARVDCIGCHFQPKPGPDGEFHGKTFVASEAACVKCHGDKFKGVWRESKTELAETLAQMKGKLDAARAALSSASSPGAAADIERASKLYLFVRESRGEHNIYLASRALRDGDAALDAAGEKLKSPLADLSALPLISGAYCATMCHAKVGVKVPPETVTAFGKRMPHRKHAEMLGCVKCHDIGAHKKTPLRPDAKAACAGCHPE